MIEIRVADAAPSYPFALRFSDLKGLCANLRRAKTEELALATWALIGEDINNLVSECQCRDKDQVIAWLGEITRIDLFVCVDCDCWRDRDKSNTTGDDLICQFCRENYSTCEDCDSLTRDEDGRSVNGGDRWCCDGCTEHYRACEQCGHEGHHDDMYRYDHEWYCEDHVPSDDDDGEDSDGVHNAEINVLEMLPSRTWLAAPGENTDRHGNGKSKAPTLWMGFELEVIPHSYRSEAVYAVTQALDGRGILKNDGSLSDDGFEIVSLPATLAYHQTGWGEAFFATLAENVRGWSEKSCGMHVHMARDALTPLQIARMQVFVNGDGKGVNNRPFIEKVAGRGATDYCRDFKKQLTDCAPVIDRHVPIAPVNYEDGCDCPSCQIQREAYQRALEASRGSDVLMHQLRRIRRECDGPLSRVCKDRRNTERYQAINLQNDRTIEFRIFQSNVAQLGFLKNLEFCHACAKFCADAGNTELHTANFLDWLDRRRGEYPNLVRWAVRENVIARRHADAPGATAPSIAA
jgi:hypothetical protein